MMIDRDGDIRVYSVEASEAGFPPGVWPDTHAFNGLASVIIITKIGLSMRPDGEVQYAVYRTPKHDLVVVWND